MRRSVLFVVIITIIFSNQKNICTTAEDTNYKLTRPDNDVQPSKVTDYGDPLFVYTKPASSIYGTQCIGDCIRGICVVTRDGDTDPCQVLENLSTYVYYTSRFKQPNYSRCMSACVEAPVSWCFVNSDGDWDYCNAYGPSPNNNYTEALMMTENDTPQQCLSPCAYKKSSQRFVCRTSREIWSTCAPPADVALPNFNITENGLALCHSQPTLQRYLCLSRKKRIDSDIENDYDEDVCRANSNPDYLDELRIPPQSGIFGTSAPGTVVNDAMAFRSRGTTNNDPSPPLVRYTTEWNAALGINMPTVVRAWIDTAALNAVVLPRPSDGIARAVPSLVRALQSIRYSYNGVSYDVGHMIGYQSGGPDADYNFAPQTVALNRGAWLNMENHIRNFVNSNGDPSFVDMLIVVYYDPTIRYLPYAFGVNLVYYFSEGVLASMCNDMMFFNQPNRRG